MKHKNTKTTTILTSYHCHCYGDKGCARESLHLALKTVKDIKGLN